MDRRFAAAARHSRLVRFLRVAVPAAVTLSLVGVVGISVFNPFRILAKLPVDLGNLVVSGTKITMQSPHMSGFSPDERPYEVWADTATQDLAKPDLVDLTVVRGKVLMEDRTTMTLESKTGLFNTKSQMLDLRKDVVMRTSEGYEARLNQATVDIAAGNVSTDDGINVKLLNGTVKADRLRLTERGDVIRFEGNVVMNVVMDPPTPTEEPAALLPPPPPPVQAVPKTRSVSKAAVAGNGAVR